MKLNYIKVGYDKKEQREDGNIMQGKRIIAMGLNRLIGEEICRRYNAFENQYFREKNL